MPLLSPSEFNKTKTSSSTSNGKLLSPDEYNRQEGGLFRKENLKKAASFTGDIAKQGYDALGDFGYDSFQLVKGAAKGEYPVTRDDVKSGIKKTFGGILSGAKFLVQETAAGLSRIGKTGLGAIYGTDKRNIPFIPSVNEVYGTEENKELETKIFGNPTRPIQDTTREFQQTIREQGATDTQVQDLGALFFVGSIFLDSPFGGGAKGAKIGTKTLTNLAKEGSEDAVKAILKKEAANLGDDVIEAAARSVARANTADEVAKALEIAAKKVNPATRIVTDAVGREALDAEDVAVRVSKELDAAQSSKTFQDAGARVSGSRKEIAAIKRLSPEQLAKLDEATQIQVTNKSRVLGDIDYTPQTLRDAGENAGDAFYKKQLLDSISAKPENFGISREIYVRELPKVADDILKSPNIIDDAGQIVDDLMARIADDAAKYDGFAQSSKIKKALEGTFGKRFVNLAKGRTQAARATRAKAQSFKGVSADEAVQVFDRRRQAVASRIERAEASRGGADYDRYVMARQAIAGRRATNPDLNTIPQYTELDSLRKAGGDEYTAKLDELVDEYITQKKDELTEFDAGKEAFIKEATREQDYSWMDVKKNADDGNAKTKTGKLKIHDYQPLEKIVRQNGRQVTDAEISPEALRENWGFDSVQFGNYVKDAEAREHVRKSVESLKDMEDILGVDLKGIIGDGKLSLAIGARGKGGALAHYEPTRKIINITKKRGDGSFGHEFAHYIDHFVGGAKGNLTKEKGYLSGGRSVKKKWDAPEGVSPEMNAKMEALVKGLMEGDAVDTKVYKAAADEKLPQIERYFDSNGYDKTLDYIKNAKASDATREKAYRVLAKKAGLDEITVETPTGKSEFMRNAQTIGSDYWTRPTELFARAFQSYLDDKMLKGNVRNNYLTHNTIAEADEAIADIGMKAYPQGAERETFEKLFDDLFAEIQKDYPAKTTNEPRVAQVIDEALNVDTPTPKAEPKTEAPKAADVSRETPKKKPAVKKKAKKSANTLSSQEVKELPDLDRSDYNKHLKDKLENAPEPKDDEVLAIYGGDGGAGQYIDTDIKVALNRGVNAETNVKIIKKADLKNPDNPLKVERGERIIKGADEVVDTPNPRAFEYDANNPVKSAENALKEIEARKSIAPEELRKSNKEAFEALEQAVEQATDADDFARIMNEAEFSNVKEALAKSDPLYNQVKEFAEDLHDDIARIEREARAHIDGKVQLSDAAQEALQKEYTEAQNALRILGEDDGIGIAKIEGANIGERILPIDLDADRQTAYLKDLYNDIKGGELKTTPFRQPVLNKDTGEYLDELGNVVDRFTGLPAKELADEAAEVTREIAQARRATDMRKPEVQKQVADVVTEKNAEISKELAANAAPKKKAAVKSSKPKEVEPLKPNTPENRAPETIDELDELTTRKIKTTDEYQAWAKYAEENFQDKDISGALMHRHATMTMERVAEFFDGSVNGKLYKTMVKPVYEGAERIAREGNKISRELKQFKIKEGSETDRLASLYAQKKITEAPANAKQAADYVRGKYDEFLERLNEVRAKLGVEPIPKRKDYITHLNELNVLTELFGGVERISVKKRISELKQKYVIDFKRKFPDQPDSRIEQRAFEKAKREVEGLTGVAQYVDARQPAFKFAKQRLSDFEKNPSILDSFNAYVEPALRYIHQGENVARNKAFKDVLPANASEFARLWNTEQVAGRNPASIISPKAKRVVSAIRGTLGANTILGNLGTTVMQLTSFPQVIAFAGLRNTMQGMVENIGGMLGRETLFKQSRTKALRDLDIDIGLGNSLADSLLKSVGEQSGKASVRNATANTRNAFQFGKDLLTGIMKTADQFTVGASWHAFYNQAIKNGKSIEDAMEFAEIMTGKTQANYFKEALPPFLNTTEGKLVGQFGTYGMNQWRMFVDDFGKDFAKGNGQKSKRVLMKQFVTFMAAAYVIDQMSEETFGRQPYDVKSLVDTGIDTVRGEESLGHLGKQATDTFIGYVPFLSSVKFGSLPPVFEFGGDVIQATLGSGDSQEKALENLQQKWSFNVLLPYGGNQARKTLQGLEAASDEYDIPLIKDVSKTASGNEKFKIEGTMDKVKGYLFGAYATDAARDYFDGNDKKDRVKENNNIGSLNENKNLAKLYTLSDNEFEALQRGYADSTKAKMIAYRVYFQIADDPENTRQYLEPLVSLDPELLDEVDKQFSKITLQPDDLKAYEYMDEFAAEGDKEKRKAILKEAFANLEGNALKVFEKELEKQLKAELE